MSGRVTALLVLLLVVQGAGLFAEVRVWKPRAHAGEPAQVSAQKPAAVTDASAIAAGLVLPPIAALSQTVTRPLFNEERKALAHGPIEEASGPASVGKRGRIPFALMAVVLHGNSRRALLRDARDGRLHWVEKDDLVNGWRTAEIRADSVVMEDGSKFETLPLWKFAPAAKTDAKNTSSEGSRTTRQQSERRAARGEDASE